MRREGYNNRQRQFPGALTVGGFGGNQATQATRASTATAAENDVGSAHGSGPAGA
jgi:hypothetical protein